MKTIEQKSEVMLSGGNETRGLSISANSKAFRELISGIYSDKAFAICRELFANAVDSHVDAGFPDKPFDVNVPSVLMPSFSIRDYGTGMSHDLIMNVYSTLFESTKDDADDETSNNFTGKFGLGSKTPFAYTDAFQLTSYMDGTMRSYDVFMDKGIPTITLFMSTETQEPNGVLVSFSVESKDSDDFERAIRKACEGLDVLPNFINSKIMIEVVTPEYEGENWKIFRSANSYDSKLRVRQGSVIYPVNPDAIIGINDTNLDAIFGIDMVVHAEIGDLEVSTSREALSYDERTSKNLIALLEATLADLKSQFKDRIDGVKNYSEFCVELISIERSLNNHRLFGYLFGSARFKGKQFAKDLDIKFYTRSEKLENDSVVTGISVADMRYCLFSTTNHVQSFHFKNKKAFVAKTMYQKGRNYDYKTVPVGKPLLIVYENDNDALKYAPSRFKTVMEEFRYEYNVLWIKSQSSNPFREFFRISCQLGHPKIKIINLAHVERQAPEKRESVTDNCFFKVMNHSTWRNSESYYETDQPPIKNAYYVNLFRTSEVLNGSMSMGDLKRAKELLVERNFLEDWPIVGVHKSQAHNLKLCPEWVLLEEKVLEAAKESISEKDVFEYEIARLLEEKIGGTVQENLEIVLKKKVDGGYRWNKKQEEIGLKASMKRNAKKSITWAFFSETRRLEAVYEKKGNKISSVDSFRRLFTTEEMIALHPTQEQRAQAEFAKLDSISEEFGKANPLLGHIDINHESINVLRKHMNLLD